MFSLNPDELIMLEIITCNLSEKKGMELFKSKRNIKKPISRRTYYRLKLELESSSMKLLRKMAESLPLEHVKITFLMEILHNILLSSIEEITTKKLTLEELKIENLRNTILARNIKTLAEIQPNRTALRESCVFAEGIAKKLQPSQIPELNDFEINKIALESQRIL